MYQNVSGGARRVLAIGVAVTDDPSSPTAALAPDGTLILMEGDQGRADEARRFLSVSGLSGRATVIGGDPRRMLYKLAGPFDLIVCDATYLSARDSLERLLAPHGVLRTHDGKR
jgi:predicted O-methyltransferase YrrM